MEIEINLTKITKGTGTKIVTVHRKGQKPFKQKFAVGKKPSRAGTGKIDKLPQDVKDEIISLRNQNYSGSQIKENIENMIEAGDPTTREKLVDANVISDIGSKLQVSPQGLTDYAKKHGAEPTKVHGPKPAEKVVEAERKRHETTKKELADADKESARLEVELGEVKDRIEANRKDAVNKKVIREKLRADLRECRAKLEGK